MSIFRQPFYPSLLCFISFKTVLAKSLIYTFHEPHAVRNKDVNVIKLVGEAINSANFTALHSLIIFGEEILFPSAISSNQKKKKFFRQLFLRWRTADMFFSENACSFLEYMKKKIMLQLLHHCGSTPLWFGRQIYHVYTKEDCVAGLKLSFFSPVREAYQHTWCLER